jgi:AcrR family transcriptional regulator
MCEEGARVQELFTVGYKIKERDESMKNSKPVVRKGRPRSFDAERALNQALQVFWRKGYEGATLSDLTKAMGINRPSLYAAFGDKEGLFRKALDRYQQGPVGFIADALKEPTGRRAVEHLLFGAAENLTDPRNPRGCLTVQGALACGDEAQGIRQELIALRNRTEGEIRDRLRRAKSAGELPADSDPGDLARFIATVIQGMAVQAAGGASRSELQRVARTAVRAWPKSA